MIFVGLNVVGVEATFRFTVFICLASLAILAVFFVGAIPNFDFDQYAIGRDGRAGSPRACPACSTRFPFAIWFYLAIEELPLAAEETHDPARDIPRGTMLRDPDARRHRLPRPVPQRGHRAGRGGARAKSGEPLLDGLKTIFGERPAARCSA